ncbi:putative WEB family protein At1g65010, chloroplastic [Sesamum indicum]|uniref:WEB family protein At1g65010, chloroplastic n=1 Tax=Sesamum indicum TaxID=4182 RepID=A0A6I9URZ5_SESIN|nr:putative WEB family protein At1g65010, chloroplastic [Sesamum indicum]
MSRSKSRSGSVDFGHKNHYSSVFSRTLSASKLCRGDAIGRQIDANALKSVDKKPSKVSYLSENRVDRTMSMEQEMGEMEEELRRTKEQLNDCEIEKHRILDQLKEAKRAADEANVKANEALTLELENLKKLLTSSRDDLKTKDKKIDLLETELGKVRELEVVLAEKDLSLDKLNKELGGLREREKDVTTLLLENKKRIEELEDEVERARLSESKMADSLAKQTKQLEATKVKLKETSAEIASLHEKIEVLEDLSKKSSVEVKGPVNAGKEIRGIEMELKLAKENLVQAQEGEKKALSKAESLIEEIELVKNEWKSAIEAEAKSAKAMEDLALALKEVATEANQAKGKLSVTENELEQVRGEARKLKEMVRSTEEKYKKLLNEARVEAELQKNTAERLRVEAEESLLAWNGKELGFVSCIKRAEEERATLQHDNNKLVESLKAAENMTRSAREETYKLRDILKQAVNEANAAKAAAGIARDENSFLKDCLTEKEEALLFLTRENERLRISEAAAKENVKQLKALLSNASTEFKFEDMEQDEATDSPDSEEEEEVRRHRHTKTFSLCVDDLKFMNEPEDDEERLLHEDPEKAEALKGSIFDANAETPKSEIRTPKSKVNHKGYYPSAFMCTGGIPHPEEFERLETPQDDNSNRQDENSHRRAKPLFRRVGDLLTIRRSFHKKDSSIDQNVLTQL